MTIVIRDAVEQDKLRCVELLKELNAAIGSVAGPSLEHSFLDLLTRTRGQIVIAEEDSSMLGMASVSYNLALRYGGEYCQLEELIVTPQARGRKLGELLLQAVIDNAINRGCAEIGLYLIETTEHNRPFYAKYGFEVVGTEMRQPLNRPVGERNTDARCR